MISAAIMPYAMYSSITSSEKPNAPVTTMRINAAAVMMRPVCAVPIGWPGGGGSLRSGLDHAGEQEHLVVDRQAVMIATISTNTVR